MLMLAKSMIDSVIPDYDDKHTRDLAAGFVANLIRNAIAQLTPDAGADAAPSALPAEAYKKFGIERQMDCAEVDAQIGQLLAAGRQMQSEC